MSSMLTPCTRCRRHVRAHEACPFCAPAPRRALAVPLAVGLTLAGCGGSVQTLEPTTPGPTSEANHDGEGNQNGPTGPAEEPQQHPPPDDTRYAVPAYGGASMPPPTPREESRVEPREEPSDDEPRRAAAYGGPPMREPPAPPRR